MAGSFEESYRAILERQHRYEQGIFDVPVQQPQQEAVQQDTQPDNSYLQEQKRQAQAQEMTALENTKYSRAFKLYTYTHADVLNEVKEINRKTGIPEEAILSEKGNLDIARGIYNETMKQMALVGPGEELDLATVYKRYPGLQKVLNSRSTTDAAIALHNVRDIKKIDRVIDSAKWGWNTASRQDEMREIGSRAWAGKATAEDYNRYEQLQKEIANSEELPDFLEDPLVNIVGGFVSQLPQQARMLGKGAYRAAEGAMAGALIGSLAAGPAGTLAGAAIGGGAAMTGAMLGAKWGMRIGMVEETFQDEVNLDFMQYKSYKDKNGNQLLTDDQCRVYAAVAAAINTGIEFANIGELEKVLYGAKGATKASLLAAIKNAKDAGSLQSVLKNWLKTPLKIAGEESTEEFFQSISDDVVQKVAAYNNPGGDIPDPTLGEIGMDAFQAFYASIGASLGFGFGAAFSGQAVGRIRGAYAVNTQLRNEATRGQVKNEIGKKMVADLREELKNSDFHKTNPEICNDIIKANLADTDYKNVYIDTEMLMDSEEGAKLLNTLVEKGELTAEELNRAVANGEDITIPVETYAQLDLDDSVYNAAEKCISFDPDVECLSRISKYGNELKARLNAIVSADDLREANAVDAFVKENFDNPKEQELARRLFLMHGNVLDGIKQERKQLVNQQQKMLAPIMEQLKAGMGHGVVLVPTEEEGRKIRMSNNATWYSKFWADNGRKPTKYELEGIAYDILGGHSRYELENWQSDGSAEAAAWEAQQQAEYDSYEREKDALDKIEEKIKKLDTQDIKVRSSLSKEGYEVYRHVEKTLENSPTKAAREAAKYNALLLAHHADVMAKAMQEAGKEGYTALDYMKDKEIRTDRQSSVPESRIAQMFPEKDQLYSHKLTGNEFGEYTDVNELRKTASNWYKENLQGKIVHNPYLGDIRMKEIKNQKQWETDVTFTRKGREKMVSTGAKIDKLLTARYLREIIENANFVWDKAGQTEKHKDEHFYYLPVVIENTNSEEKYAIVTVEGFKSGKLIYYNHNVFTEEEFNKIKSTFVENPGAQLPMPGWSSQEALFSNSSIANNKENVNSENVKENTQPETHEQRAWQGTSADEYERMSTDYIGTGEGALAHGWGLYFAQDKEVAKGYRDRMVKKNRLHLDASGVGLYDINQNGTKIDKNSDVGKFLYEYLSRVGQPYLEENWQSPDSVLQLKSKIEADLNGWQAELNEIKEKPAKKRTKLEKDRISWLEKRIAETKSIYNKVDFENMTLFKRENYGHYMEAEIPDNDVLLDEDLKFDEQPAAVKKGLDVIADAYGGDLKEKIHNSIGRDIYANLRDNILHDTNYGKDTSLLLNKHGIKGITYDGRQDKRCFVVFDDKAVEIIQRYHQDAYHGTTDSSLKGGRFDLGYVGTGSGGTYHGYGLYFASDKEVADSYKGKYGITIKADIPENNVMLDEQLSFDKQPAAVRQALDKLAETATDEILENVADLSKGRPAAVKAFKEMLHNSDGKAIYGSIWDIIADSEHGKETSALLNKYGIKGIKYIDKGRTNFVVFDDKAISIINKYNQEHGTTRGSIEIYETGKRIINLFPTANQSTFMHEAGHLFLADIKELAEMEGAPAWAVKDWETVKQWLKWGKNQQALTSQQHEKFARAFEEYLREGKAPTEALQGAFRKFKAFLTDIYKTLRQLVEPSEDIRRVMDRMLATQQDIDNAVALKEYKSFERGGGTKYLDGTTQEIYKRIKQEVKDAAYEKTLTQAFEDEKASHFKEKEEYFKNALEWRRQELMQQPEFVIEQYLKDHPTANEDAVITMLGMTPEEYRQKMDEAGGSLDAALKAFKKELEADNMEDPTDEEFRKRAEDAVNTSQYYHVQTAFELEALNKIAAQQHRLERMAKAQKQNTKAAAATDSQKQQKEQILAGIRVTRDATKGLVKKIHDFAREKMATLPIREATDEAKWRNLSRRRQLDCFTSMSKREWMPAVEAKQEQLYYDMMAEMAANNARKVEKIANRLASRSKTIQKNNNLPAGERYAYNHFLYVFGLADRDALIPPDYSFTELMAGIDANLENAYVTQDEKGNTVLDIPDWAMNAATSREQRQDGYNNLTVDEFKGLSDLMYMIYKSGADAKKTRTITDPDGAPVLIDQAVATIAKEADERLASRVNKDPTGAERPGIIDRVAREANLYNLQNLKPETILRELGPSAVRYIYQPLKHAADAEYKMAKDFTEKLKKILSVYDKNFDKKKTYQLGTSRITKSQLLAVALNWGTELNKKRICDGFDISENDIKKLLGNLDKRDWQTVTDIWALVNSYWEDTKRVEAAATGVVLEKQEAVPFTIVGNDGAVYQLEGGYYPIKYDRRENVTLGERDSEQELKASMAGMTQLGMRKGFTKQRVQGKVNGKIDLDLIGVATSSLIDVTHNIAYREAIRDVNKLVRDQNFTALVQDKFGADTVRYLRKWVLDSWAPAPESMDMFSRAARFFRVNTTSSMLGYRFMTALMNAGNITPMMSYLRESESSRTGTGKGLAYGVMAGIRALKNYYGNPFEIRAKRRFITSKSVFMSDRIETIDRDIRAVRKDINKKRMSQKISGYFQEYAFKLIEETDLMVGLPMWYSEYERELKNGLDKGLSYEVAERNAVDAGDAAVRRTIASGRQIDLSGYQRGSELQKNFTMYSSYMNTVYNALAWKYAEAKRLRYQGAGLLKAMAPIADGLILWVAGNAFLNGGLRYLTGDDDKDIEGFLKAWAFECVDTGTGGLIYFKDIIAFIFRQIMGEKQYRNKGIPIEQMTEEIEKLIADVMDNDKKLSVKARDFFAVLSRATGYSKTALDSIPTFIQWAEEDFDDDVAKYLKAILMDKKPQQGKY